MIEIAGGILLAVLVLVFLPVILSVAAIGLILALAAGAIMMIYLMIEYGNETAHGVLVVVVGIGMLCFIAFLFSRRAKPRRLSKQNASSTDLKTKDGRFRHYVDDPIIPPMPDRGSPEWADWRDKKGKWVNR